MYIHTPPFVQTIIQKFQQANYEIYIVGGAVRDLLNKKKAKDWDFTTNANPAQILDLFPDGFYDNQFGTVGIVDPEDKKSQDHRITKSQKHKNETTKQRNNETTKLPIYEITTFRKEFGYSNNRHPDKIEWGQTLEEDLQRRDFTINAMALKPQRHPELVSGSNLKAKRYKLQDKFTLIDLFNGQSDLKNHLIRAVGNPSERFNEDALRMIRAVRFAAQLGFIIEPETLKAIQNNAPLIKQIANERIRDELFKLLTSEYPDDGVRVLAGTGLMEYIIPELLDGQGVDQAGHHVDDVWEHSIKSLQNCPNPDPVVRLATLIHDIGKPKTRAYVCQKCQTRFRPGTPKLSFQESLALQNNTPSLLTCPKCGFSNDYYQSVTFYNHEMAGAKIAARLADRLRLSRKQKDKLIKLVRWHMFSVDERQTDKAHRRFIRHVGKEHLNDILDLRTADRLGGGARETSWRYERFKKKLIEVQKQPFTLHDLKISGNEIMKELNLQPGPQVGQVLKQLYNEIVDKKVANTHRDLLNRLKEIKRSK